MQRRIHLTCRVLEDLRRPHMFPNEESRLQVYSELFSDGTPERMDQLFRYLDKDDTGCIDFMSWSRRIRLQACLPHPQLSC